MSSRPCCVHSSSLVALALLASIGAEAATQLLQVSGCGSIGTMELGFSSVATVDTSTFLTYNLSRNPKVTVNGQDYPATLLSANQLHGNDNKINTSAPYLDTYGFALNVTGNPYFTSMSVSQISGQPTQYQGITNNGLPVVIGCLNVAPAKPRPTLLGCFNDAHRPPNVTSTQYPGRVFYNVTIFSGGVSVDNCGDVAEAMGWPYFGLQYGRECWWGHSTYAASTPYGNASAVCNSPCNTTDYVPGDQCGGTYTYSLYKLAA